MKNSVRFSWLFGFLVMALTIVFSSSLAFADDPPSRVGRLSYLEGTVSFHAADASDWTLATLNYPVTSGNAFWTDADGRNEIQIGAVEVRMDHMTELNVVELDDNATRLEVPQGIVNVHVRAVPIGGSVQVMTPNGPIALVQPGTYHIDSGHPAGEQPSNQVLVTVFEGQLQINGPRSLLEVMPGETAILNGNPPAFSLQEGNPTPFDDWALMLEKREAEAHQSPYVSAYMTGAQDLDHYGQWHTAGSYGPVWYPATVQADWAPYRYGHWAFVQPWGWTWVDEAPWGFAPFHYGRWVQVEGRWGWTPGTYIERPVYAPALVAFVGGSGWSISLSVGGAGSAIGWIPLGPHEVFHPYYPTSVNYVRNVNITHVDKTVIDNITVNNYKTVTVTNYVNQKAATVVPSNSFTQGASVHHAMVAVPEKELSHAPITPTVAHLEPTAAVRAGGSALPEKAHEDLPHGAPAGMMHPAAGPSETNSSVPVEPATSPHPAAMETVHPSTVNMPPSKAEAVQSERETKQTAAAPAPVHHAPVPAWPTSPQHDSKAAGEHRPEAAAPLPHANVAHPEQKTRIAPTPQGWQRVVAHPEEAKKPAEPAHEPQPSEPHKPGEDSEHK